MHHARTPHVAWFAGVALVALAACASNLTPPGPTARRELAAASAGDPGRAGDPQLRQLDHIVVIYLENRSFDNVYGEFAGADGLAAAASAPPQVDGSGTPFATLPAGDHHHLRRERWLLGPRGAAGGGPLGPRQSGADTRDFTVRPSRGRGSSPVRHHVDPGADRASLGACAALDSRRRSRPAVRSVRFHSNPGAELDRHR